MMSDFFWTVFFDDDSGEMPQDFDSYYDAEEYAKDRVERGYASSYTIETPCRR